MGIQENNQSKKSKKEMPGKCKAIEVMQRKMGPTRFERVIPAV